MSDNFFDNRFEDRTVEITDNIIKIGEDFKITEKDPTLRSLVIGAGWDADNFASDIPDGDLSLFLIGKDDKTRTDEDFVFYNAPETCEGGIRHLGDSRTGAGEGDDESIRIDLQSIPFDVMRIDLALSIYKGEEKEQNFSMLRNVFVRLVNADTSIELCRVILDDVFKDQTATGAVIGHILREGPKWRFEPRADLSDKGLQEIAEARGLTIVDQ